MKPQIKLTGVIVAFTPSATDGVSPPIYTNTPSPTGTYSNAPFCTGVNGVDTCRNSPVLVLNRIIPSAYTLL
jgi:hypothetical protein